MVTVAYERQLFRRNSNYRTLTEKIWVFWIGGHGISQEVVTRGGLTSLQQFLVSSRNVTKLKMAV